MERLMEVSGHTLAYRDHPPKRSGQGEPVLNNRNRLSLDSRELLFALDELVRTKPDDYALLEIRPENHDWVGRARALIAANA